MFRLYTILFVLTYNPPVVPSTTVSNIYRNPPDYIYTQTVLVSKRGRSTHPGFDNLLDNVAIKETLQ